MGHGPSTLPNIPTVGNDPRTTVFCLSNTKHSFSVRLPVILQFSGPNEAIRGGRTEEKGKLEATGRPEK